MKPLPQKIQLKIMIIIMYYITEYFHNRIDGNKFVSVLYSRTVLPFLNNYGEFLN